MTTLEKLKNEGYDGEKLKLDTAIFDEKNDSCAISFVYNAKENFSSTQKTEIKKLIEDDIGDICAVKVKFNKYSFDEDVVRSLIDNYFELHYKALRLVFTPDDISILKNEESVIVTLQCDVMTKLVLENKAFDTKLAEFLKQKSFENFCVKLLERKSDLQETNVASTFDDSLEK